MESSLPSTVKRPVPRRWSGGSTPTRQSDLWAVTPTEQQGAVHPGGGHPWDNIVPEVRELTVMSMPKVALWIILLTLVLTLSACGTSLTKVSSAPLVAYNAADTEKLASGSAQLASKPGKPIDPVKYPFFRHSDSGNRWLKGRPNRALAAGYPSQCAFRLKFPLVDIENIHKYQCNI